MKLPQLETRWYVIRAKPGCESLAADELHKGGYDYYLPMMRRKNFIRRARLITDAKKPLLPGYLFIGTETQIDWGRLHNERLFPHVGRPLRGLDGPLQISSKIVVKINEDEIAGKYDETGATKKQNRAKLAEQFAAGLMFRVVDGPFASFWAESEGVSPNDRVKVLINIFNRLVSMELEPGQLEAA